MIAWNGTDEQPAAKFPTAGGGSGGGGGGSGASSPGNYKTSRDGEVSGLGDGDAAVGHASVDAGGDQPETSELVSGDWNDRSDVQGLSWEEQVEDEGRRPPLAGGEGGGFKEVISSSGAEAGRGEGTDAEEDGGSGVSPVRRKKYMHVCVFSVCTCYVQ